MCAEECTSNHIPQMVRTGKDDSGPKHKIIEQTNTLRNASKTLSEVTIAQVVKLRRQKVEILKRLRVEKNKKTKSEKI